MNDGNTQANTYGLNPEGNLQEIESIFHIVSDYLATVDRNSRFQSYDLWTYPIRFFVIRLYILIK